MSNMEQIVEKSFSQYAAAVLQNRALVDVRDCIKPSARQIFYCMYTDNFIHSRPFQKTLKAIGSAMRIYIHGDSSCEGVIMRAGQPFAMRYPLVEVEGSYGNLMESGNYAAPRYTASRLSELSNYLFKDLKKDVITEWRDNYDDTEKYPTFLPSKGFYNIVNGNFGLGVGAASSICQYNLKEVNEALIKLLWNPLISFEEIYCAPDFATGAILLNEDEVKESMRNGQGKACKLRAVVNFDSKERCLVATEIPYSVYTNTICGELETILNSEENPGIERFNDLTGAEPNIKIYLTKNANVEKVLKYLYKNTSLQSHYGINMTMLDDGRFPRVFTWKEALQAHLDHEVEVYTLGFKYDLSKIAARLHIIDALLRAIAQIEEVISTIKKSTSAADASTALQKLLVIDETQAKAILEIKLSRFAHLEVSKLQKEQTDLLSEKERIEAILSDNNLLFKEIERGLREVVQKFGDARRTKILNIENEEDEPTEIRSLTINLTNQNNLIVNENSSLYTQKRGGVGLKFKLNPDEYVVTSISAQSTDTILFFARSGYFYHCEGKDLTINEKTPIESIFNFKKVELICEIATYNKSAAKSNIILFTKNGMMKKSLLSEYNLKRSGAAKAIELASDDEVCSVVFTNNEPVGIMTEKGNFIMCGTKDVNPIGRVSKGVHAIKLGLSDAVAAVHPINDKTTSFMTITNDGYIKKTKINEFNITGRNTKGTKIQKPQDGAHLIDFIPLADEKEIIIVSSKSQIKINPDEVAATSKNTLGIRSIKMAETDKIIGLIKF